MMKQKLMLAWLLAVFVFACVPIVDAAMTCPAGATCKYVRPADDGNGTTFSYGLEDGSSEANAFKGFADMTGLVPGDTVCLPGSDEPFFINLLVNTSGTETAPLTFVGCGPTRALLWSASSLDGNRSFDAAKALVTGPQYEWVLMGNNIWRKETGVRTRMLWEDETFIYPVEVGTDSEATILSTLAVGFFCNRDAGGGVFHTYYRATTLAKNPANTIIRTHYVPITPSGWIRIQQPHLVFRNMEVRGQNDGGGSDWSLIMLTQATHILLDELWFRFNTNNGPNIAPLTVANYDTTFRNLHALDGLSTGIRANAIVGLHRLTVEGGEYSRQGIIGAYNGTTIAFTGDGDGIGIGWTGGPMSDIVIRDIVADGNKNRGVFSGTSDPNYFLTNFSLIGARMNGNGRGCFSEGNDAEIRGVLLISGLVCTGTLDVQVSSFDFPALHFSSSYPSNATPPNPFTSREIIVENSTFKGNLSNNRIEMEMITENHYTFRNIVFDSNPGDPGNLNDRGDFYTHSDNLAGTIVMDNIWFNSLPNLSRPFAVLGVAQTAYLYNVGGDQAAFIAAINTVGSATNLTFNTDPLLLSNGQTKPNSPLRGAGKLSSYCRDARDRVCSPDHPDIGAYQTSSGDLR